MPYRVQVATAARREAENYHLFILNQSHDSLPADSWWNGLLDALDSLRSLPARCPRIPEQHRFDLPLYQLLYASHRIIFRIDPKVVRVVRVYHSAKRPLTSLRQRP
jgi:toxin ParE1/3/4